MPPAVFDLSSGVASPALRASSPIDRLLQPEVVAREDQVRSIPPHGVMQVPYFQIEGARVWGATAMVLAEFAALLHEDG